MLYAFIKSFRHFVSKFVFFQSNTKKIRISIFEKGLHFAFYDYTTFKRQLM